MNPEAERDEVGEALECGLTAIAMILAHSSNDDPPDSLRYACEEAASEARVHAATLRTHLASLTEERAFLGAAREAAQARRDYLKARAPYVSVVADRVQEAAERMDETYTALIAAEARTEGEAHG